jgi:hypothetical protein
MSSTDRQNRLLVAEDWKRIYQSYRNADFQSYDFENLRRIMVDYLRQNYPEDFNDYIESSEYLALIDMIAFLGQSIAFRVDLNARENFLELAERRESVLRLSRMLGYNAKRNQAANGLLKFTSISTTQPVIDSNGRNLSGQEIIWNDTANTNWYDQFIKVINSAMPVNKQFGNPESKAVVYNIPTEQYRVQSSSKKVAVYGFTKVVDGRNMNFEIVSTIIKDGMDIVEDPPQAGKNLAFVYRDDGRGAASQTNGFFLHFRQGSLSTGSFSIDKPSTNEIVDIDAPNINDTDVWLYKLDVNGIEQEYWAKVSSFEGNNIIYNSLKKNIRNIYGVVTRADDRISLTFSDGTFGTLPSGTFRVYYRVSNGLSYSINPKSIKNVSISVPYISGKGQVETLTITLGLQSSITNSSLSESNTEIKSKAPATYYTQNRMITAEDYNINPLSVNQDVAKIKTVNRSSSGINRYFDLNDPTGKYSSTNLFGDDGVLYKEQYEDEFRFTYISKTDIEAVIYNQVLDFIKDVNIRNFYYDNFGKITVTANSYFWNQVTQDTNQSTGYFTNQLNLITGYRLGNDLKNLEPGALFKFVPPAGKVFLKTNRNALVTGTTAIPNSVEYLWAKVVNVSENGEVAVLANGQGPVTLSIEIPSTAILVEIIPKWRTNLDTTVISDMIDLIFSNKPFGLRYNLNTKSWVIIYETNLSIKDLFNIGRAGDVSNQKLDSSWLILFTTDTENYTVKSRKLKYIFESDRQIRFYFDANQKVYDNRTNKVVKDQITILDINTEPDSTSPFGYNLNWEISKEFLGTDGFVDTKKIELNFNDRNDDGIVDDPDIFDIIVAPSTDQSKYIILERYETINGQLDYRYIKNDNLIKIKFSSDDVTVLEKVNGQYFYFITTDTIARWDNGRFVSNLNYKVYQGRENLKFQYVHSADYESRIDPGQTNIMDLFVMTKQYDLEFRKWLTGNLTEEPLPPSSDQLSLMLSPSLNNIKAMSDEIVYHPVKYKVLFGPKASLNLRATFKLIKNLEQTISDNQLKTNVLSAINEFFALENWDFGDSFYFSELVAYVMARTAPFLSNMVIVPRQSNLFFGSLFEIRAESDQIFINGTTSDDIEIISAITAYTISSEGSISSANSTLSQQNITSQGVS